MRKQAGDSMEFIEHVKIDLFPDEIYVFTPKGSILELPAGATPIDFAYAIHTDIGNACVACRVNKKLASLSEPLQSGQTVEIITAPGAKPSRAWLNIVVSGKAKSSIRHYLKQQQQAESYELGKQLLEKSLSGINKSWDDISEEQINRVLEHNQLDSFDALLRSVGLGMRMPYILARQLVSEEDPEVGESAIAVTEQQVMIKGTEGMNVSFAHCCYPIPGDPIIGFPEGEQGLVIHSEGCTKAMKVAKDKMPIHLSWVKDITDEFVVELRVELERQRGIIAELANAITRAEANIERIGVEEQNARHSVVSVIIHVQGRRHLARVMRRIRGIKAVLRLNRIVN